MYMYVMVRVLVEATTCRWVGMEGEDLGGGGWVDKWAGK